MDILVNVVNQKLRIATNLQNLVSGSQEFIRFVFNLSEDWDDLHPFAQFQQKGVAYNRSLDLENDNSVYLPQEIKAGTCDLILYGSNNGRTGTTNYVTLFIDENIFIYDSADPEHDYPPADSPLVINITLGNSYTSDTAYSVIASAAASNRTIIANTPNGLAHFKGIEISSGGVGAYVAKFDTFTDIGDVMSLVRYNVLSDDSVTRTVIQIANDAITPANIGAEATPVTINLVGTTPTVATATDNKIYVAGEVSSVAVSAQSGSWVLIFTSGSTPTSLTMPNTVTMPDDFQVEANRRYEISVSNGYAVAASWAVSSS